MHRPSRHLRKKAGRYAAYVVSGCLIGALICASGIVPVKDASASTWAPSDGAKVETSMPDDGTECIDGSHVDDGYLTVRTTTGSHFKVGMEHDGDVLNVDVPDSETSVLPVEWSGTVSVTIYRQVSGNTYSIDERETFDVSANDDKSTYSIGSCLVPTTDKVSGWARDATSSSHDETSAVCAIADATMDSLSYDHALADAGGVHDLDLDGALSSGSGICIDYATLMASGCRSVGIPCKVVTGYYGSEYHAWCEVWVEDTTVWHGEILTGGTWQRIDPTVMDCAGPMANDTYSEVHEW